MINGSEITGSRRHFLATQSMGICSLALAWLLHRDQVLGAPIKPSFEKPTFDLKAKRPHFQPRATAMISMFMQGGPSHVDLFDPKPELIHHHMQEAASNDFKFDSVDQASRKLYAPQWKFKKYGECGIEMSELLPHLGSVADEICLIRSMKTGVNNHGQSILALQSGAILPGKPSLGSWVTYALGSESDSLPAFMVLRDPASLPVEGVYNWSNGWLPSLFQGTVARPIEPRIPNLDPPAFMKGATQQRFLNYLQSLNREHLSTRPNETDLAARIASYELAAKMQVAAKEAFDISDESTATKSMYGLDQPESREFGTRCLIARRLVERGVRFIQIFTRNQEWDHHNDLAKNLPPAVKKIDAGSAALVRDLKQRGLLDTTLVHWGGEMGRLPVIQNEKNIGRDHNTYGFSMWLAGGGLKRGMVYGATDEIGHRAAENVVMHYDYHATLFHLFGLNYEHVNFQRPNGVGALIENEKPRLVSDIIA